MITDLWIENFKGIGKRQHIPLRPITLLFGINSAGKSTVLHALLYLREMVCYHNFDPKKSLAGEQTVNLGGIDNLLHVAGDQRFQSPSFTLGCRVHISPGDWHEKVSWEHARFAFRTDSYGYCWVDPVVGMDYLRAEAGTEEKSPTYDESLENDLDFDIQTTVDRRGIRALRIAVDGETYMCGWRDTASVGLSWWINIFHDNLAPNPNAALTDPSNSKWTNFRTSKLAKLAQKLRVMATNGALEYWDKAAFQSVELNIVRSVLTCPELKLAGDESPVHSMPSNLVFVTLASFLQSLNYPQSLSEKTEDTVALDGAFVGLVLDDGAEDPISIANLGFVWCVATQKDSSCALSTVVEKVRLACLCEALAGKFGLVSDDNGFPGAQVSSLGGSDECYGFLGNSLCGPSRTQHNWFDQQRARLDQTLRMGLMDFERSLREVCYVGPKRSTVPRNLNSDVMGDHTDWGDGLGAWNWMLQCSDDDLEICGEWLDEATKGLGTGFSLRRQELYEVEEHLLNPIRIGHSPREYLSDEELLQLEADVENSRSFTKISLIDRRANRNRHPQDVGEGITQVIPVIAALVRASSSEFPGGALTAIEQPELHLHPSLAAKVGDLVISTALKNCKSVALIETHSEHLILRILRRIRQTTDGEKPEHIPPVKPDEVCVLWVDNLGDGTIFKRLEINKFGDFIDRWPRGFFTERSEELF